MHLRQQLSLVGWFTSRFIPAMVLACAACAVAAQPREVSRGDLVLRSSTVASERIDPATASRHGIEPAPNRAVLNVVLLRGPKREAIAADVTALTRTLAGVRREIALKEVRENDRVSYVGSYEFLPKEVIDVEITARPLQPDQSRPLTLSYRERMWQPR